MSSDSFWQIEVIPKKDYLFQRVHKNLIFNGNLSIGLVFKNHGAGMSTDWSKYSTPQKTKKRVKKLETPKDPANYGVINMNVKKVRDINGQIVEHTPIKDNRAHTDVKGEKTAKVKVLFSRIYEWSIKPPVPLNK